MRLFIIIMSNNYINIIFSNFPHKFFFYVSFCLFILLRFCKQTICIIIW